MRVQGELFVVGRFDSARRQDLQRGLLPEPRPQGGSNPEHDAEGGDFAFEGEITGYTSTTASVSCSSETALLNRLTITVNVRFTNAVDESMSWKKTFSAFEDFDSSKLLNEIEGELIPQIVDKLVTDIFQASAANW